MGRLFLSKVRKLMRTGPGLGEYLDRIWQKGKRGEIFGGLTNKGVEVNLAELICYEDFRESRYSLSLSLSLNIIYIYIYM